MKVGGLFGKDKRWRVGVSGSHQREERVEALTSIPDLQADDRVRVRVDDALGQEAGADRRRGLGRVEGALAVAHDERRLTDALRAEDDDLGFERGRHYFGFFCLFLWFPFSGSRWYRLLFSGLAHALGARLLALDRFRPRSVALCSAFRQVR